MFDANLAAVLLQHSGATRGGVTWFTDPVGPLPNGFYGNKIMWIPWQNDESWSSYLERVHKESSNGVALGRRQLGVRLRETDARWVPPPRLWSVRWLPSNLTGYDLGILLSGMGFCELETSEKIVLRQGAVWTFKAKRQDDLQVVQGRFDAGNGEVEVQAILEAKRRGGDLPTTRLANERRVNFNQAPARKPWHDEQGPRSWAAHALDELEQPEVEADERADESKDDSVPGHTVVVEKSESGISKAKRAARATFGPSKAPALRSKWSPKGDIQTNPGGGDCLYHSIAQGLEAAGDLGSSGKARSHRQLRAFVSAVFKAEKFTELWVGQGKGNKQDETADFDTLLQNAAMAGTWAGALELLAFCLKYDVEAWVGSPNGQVYQFHADGRDMGVFLWYRDEHYQFIRAADRQEWLERKRQQDEEGGLQIVALRGGVPGSIWLSDFRSASSAKRSQTSSAGASANGKAGAKLSARQSVKRPAREDGPALDDFASSSSTTLSFRAPAASVGPKLRGSKAKRVSQGSCKAKKAQRASGEPWVCNLCGFLADGNAEQIKGKKSRHLAQTHPEVPRSRFDRRKIPRRSSLTAPKCTSRGFSNLDKALVSLGTPWVCGICGFLGRGHSQEDHSGQGGSHRQNAPSCSEGER